MSIQKEIAAILQEETKVSGERAEQLAELILLRIENSTRKKGNIKAAIMTQAASLGADKFKKRGGDGSHIAKPEIY